MRPCTVIVRLNVDHPGLIAAHFALTQPSANKLLYAGMFSKPLKSATCFMLRDFAVVLVDQEVL